MIRTLSCCLLLAASLQGAATKTYSNFTTKLDVSRLGPVPIGFIPGSPVFVFATQFTAGVAGSLDTVEFAAFPGVGNSATISLYTDNGGLPGMVLETFAATLPAAGPSGILTVRGRSQAKTPLLQGTAYWIVLNVADPTTDSFSWGFPRTAASGLTVFSEGGGPWMTYVNEALTLTVTVN